MDGMNRYQHRSLITKPFNLTYSYYLSPGFHEKAKARSDIPVLLICHGFPDHAKMWAGVVPHFEKLGYPVVVPDLLGFGGSSKPADASKYNYRTQANALCQVLECEGITKDSHKVIPIGHDWGSATCQRFYLYHPDRCAGLAITSLAYQIPSPDAFDLPTVNEQTLKRFGYRQWEYWNFFTAPDAPELMRRNVERFWEVNNDNYISDKEGEKGRDT